jgi:hypothetical protein
MGLHGLLQRQNKSKGSVFIFLSPSRLRNRVDNIKMNLRVIGWDGVDWIDMAQDRNQWRAFVNTALNLRVP